MPNAADPAIRGGQLPLSHNPLIRLNYSTPKPPVDLGDIAEKLLEFVQNLLLDAIKDVTGIDLSTPEAFWNSIMAIVTQTFTGFEGGLEQLEEWAHTIQEDAENALEQLAAMIDRALGTGHDVEDFVLWLETFLTPNSALNASNLWGLLPAGVSIKVPSTSVTAEQAQPLWNPNFEGAISFQPLAGWAWDSTVYYQTSTNMPGSAAVTADRAVHALRSNPFPVDSGQRLTPTAYVLTSGLVCTGSPIKLDVITYLGDTQVAIVELVSMGAPTGDTTGWTNPPSGSKAGTMSATYTVPDDGTVDAVKLRIVLDSTATAGTVRFGAVPTVIEGGLISDLQSDLTTIQADETAKAAATATLWQDIGTAITTYGLTDWEAMAVAINAAYQTWNTIVTGIDASEDETILSLLSSLLGINLSTGGNTGAETAQAWATRLTNDLLILLDVFHLTYTTTQWNAAWSDLLALFGIVNSTTTPTTPAPTIGPAITTAQATANTGVTNAGTAQSAANAQLVWWQRLSEDLWILADLFHIYYPLGSPSDTATTTSGGKRTYYSAQADIKLLFNQSQSVTPPALTVVDPGSQIQSNTAAATTAGTNASTALTNAASATTAASDAASTAQGAIDATVQALTGSSATGAAPAAAKASQQAIPVANIAPPPSPSATGIPIHGTSGTGWGSGTVNPSGASSLTVTGSHTKATDDNWIGFWVVTCVGASGLSAPFNASLTASYGSLVLATIAQATILVSSNVAWVLSYVGAVIPSSFNPPSAQTCTAQIRPGSGLLAYGIAAVSDSYSGVLSVKAAAVTPGTQGITGSNPAQAGVASSVDNLVTQAFAAVALLTTVSLTSYNKTSRANPSLSGMGAGGVALFAGEAAGNTSVSFSATMTSTSDYYAGVAINLVGVGTDPIGSVFKAARTSTAVVSGSSGVNVFPANFWPSTPVELTADFTWSSSTGTLTCLNAGTYTFAVGILEAAIGTPHYLRAAIFHGGAVEAQGTTCSVTTTASGLWAASVSDTFYCGVGDTIQAGAYLSTAVASVFTGESTSSLTYFSAALANRGTIS